MDTAYTKIKMHLAGWHDWEMNPVLVKELRQAMRNRFLTGTLMVLLVLLFAASLGPVMRENFVSVKDGQLGRTLCRMLLLVLIGASFLFIPLYTGLRMTMERRQSDLDLMFVTTLRPKRIIRGKLLCGA